MPNIRPAKPQDEPHIQRVIKTAYDEFGFGWDPQGYNHDLYNLSEHFATPNQFWVAEEGQTILGCIGIEIFPAHPGQPGETATVHNQTRIAAADCELVRLYLAKEARGKKIGYALATTCINYARANNCQHMEIWSDTVLLHAHKLYKKLGAAVITERICPPPDETPEFGMILTLN